MQETQVQSLCWEDLLEKEVATHFSFLTWEIPWTEEPGGLQSMGLQRVGHDWVIKQQHINRSDHPLWEANPLEWVAISFSNAWKWKVKVKLLSHVWLLATPWTAAYQAPPSMGFSREVGTCQQSLRAWCCNIYRQRVCKVHKLFHGNRRWENFLYYLYQFKFAPFFPLKSSYIRNCLTVQWLDCAFTAKAQVRSLVRKLKSLQAMWVAKKKKQLI